MEDQPRQSGRVVRCRDESVRHGNVVEVELENEKREDEDAALARASEQDVREVENIQLQRVCEDLLDHVHESQRDQRERLVKADLVEELQTLT